MATEGYKATPQQAERLHRFAHDIRNKLIGIREVLRHLAQPTADVDAAELTTFGEQQFYKALREVESLLDDMAVDRGVGSITMIPCDLAVITTRTLTDMEHRFAKKEQTVVTSLASDPIVQGDAQCLADLIGALLSNASKFSARGSTIHVNLQPKDNLIELRVRDEGVGLSAADLDQLFVRYAWLGSKPTEDEAQGRGTLARAAQWAQAHGGSLRGRSDGPGHGSTFVLELPTG